MTRAYLVIFPVDFDGSLEVVRHAFMGTYEQVEGPIIALVDAHVRRGVDGMALEAWLVVGAVGSVYTVTQDERPVCCVVRMGVPS